MICVLVLQAEFAFAGPSQSKFLVKGTSDIMKRGSTRITKGFRPTEPLPSVPTPDVTDLLKRPRVFLNDDLTLWRYTDGKLEAEVPPPKVERINDHTIKVTLYPAKNK